MALFKRNWFSHGFRSVAEAPNSPLILAFSLRSRCAIRSLRSNSNIVPPSIITAPPSQINKISGFHQPNPD